MPAVSLVISIESVDVSRLDGLDVDALVLPMFEIVAQPQGAAGYVDWRLSGRIGRMLHRGEFSGASREVVLCRFGARIKPARLFLMGLGAPGIREQRQCHEDMEWIVDVLTRAQVTSVALAPPEPEPSRLMESWLSAPACARARFDRLVLLDAAGKLERDRIAASIVGRGLSFA